MTRAAFKGRHSLHISTDYSTKRALLLQLIVDSLYKMRVDPIDFLRGWIVILDMTLNIPPWLAFGKRLSTKTNLSKKTDA